MTRHISRQTGEEEEDGSSHETSLTAERPSDIRTALTEAEKCISGVPRKTSDIEAVLEAAQSGAVELLNANAEQQANTYLATVIRSQRREEILGSDNKQYCRCSVPEVRVTL